jgi:hypothetical protein
MITGVLIVGMVAHSKMTKYPFYLSELAFADFQNFVIVGEHRVLQNMTVHAVLTLSKRAQHVRFMSTRPNTTLKNSEELYRMQAVFLHGSRARMQGRGIAPRRRLLWTTGKSSTKRALGSL